MRKLFIKLLAWLGIIVGYNIYDKTPERIKRKVFHPNKRMDNYPEHIKIVQHRHRGVYVKVIDTDAYVFCKTQQEAADWIKSFKEYDVKRHDVYNALRYKDGVVRWGEEVLAYVRYTDPELD